MNLISLADIADSISRNATKSVATEQVETSD